MLLFSSFAYRPSMSVAASVARIEQAQHRRERDCCFPGGGRINLYRSIEKMFGFSSTTNLIMYKKSTSCCHSSKYVPIELLFRRNKSFSTQGFETPVVHFANVHSAATPHVLFLFNRGGNKHAAIGRTLATKTQANSHPWAHISLPPRGATRKTP